MKYLFALILLAAGIKSAPIQEKDWILSSYSHPPYFDQIDVDPMQCDIVVRFEARKNRIRTTFSSTAYYEGTVNYGEGNLLDIEAGISHTVGYPGEECHSRKPSKVEFKLMLTGTFAYELSDDALILRYKDEEGNEGSMRFIEH